jgi:hypothetical protein
LALGAGDGGGPRVRLVRANGHVLADFFADDAKLRGGARVAFNYLAGLVVGSGPGTPASIRFFDPQAPAAGPYETILPFDTVPPEGVYVG